MKNKLIILVFFILLFNDLAISKEFIFKTKNLEITNGGKSIISGKGTALSADGELEIKSNKFEYDKELNILKTFGQGLLIINSKNLEINFDESVIDQNNFIIKTSGNSKIFDKNNNLIIKSNFLIYDQNKMTINAKDKVKITDISNNLIIETEDITYDQKQELITSNTKTEIQDKNQNYYVAEKFLYEINKNLLKVDNLNFKDNENNKLKTSLAYINTKTNRLFGKDISVDLNNRSFNKDNEPRLKGNSIVNDKDSATITKGIFTTCKRRDDCPPWQLSAEEIQHDKVKKTINYKNALLSIYDVPVIYFPKFFHPDPTVKRQSGFLIPSINNSNNSPNYLNTPYFIAISQNKDATLSPRFYSDDKFLFQTEFRQANKTSNHIADLSFFAEKQSSKNHVFYKFDKVLNLNNFEKSKLDFKVQKTSNDTYLKKNKIQTEIVSDEDILENSFKLDLYSNNLSINLETTIYENLNKRNTDRFEFILPRLDLVKKIDNKTNLKGDFLLRSRNLMRNYDTNILEKSNINDLVFTSYPKVTASGYYNNYEFLIKNSNTDSENSSNFKKDGNIFLSSIFQFNSTLPLIKENEIYQKILTPKISLKLAPPYTKDQRKNKDNKVNLNNLFSLNRITDNDAIEGGVSLAYGSDYSIYDKKNNKELINFKVGNNLRLNENMDLPSNNQLDQKTSNFFSETTLYPTEFFNLKYSTSIKNNLSDISYENIISEFKVNNFITTFDYVNENNINEEKSYLTNTVKMLFDESNNLSFSTRENKTADLTEYYNLMYQYKNDCLAASVEYNKEYYNDRDIEPNESIFFKLTIIPFGETSSPNLKN